MSEGFFKQTECRTVVKKILQICIKLLKITSNLISRQFIFSDFAVTAQYIWKPHLWICTKNIFVENSPSEKVNNLMGHSASML